VEERDAPLRVGCSGRHILCNAPSTAFPRSPSEPPHRLSRDNLAARSSERCFQWCDPSETYIAAEIPEQPRFSLRANTVALPANLGGLVQFPERRSGRFSLGWHVGCDRLEVAGVTRCSPNRHVAFQLFSLTTGHLSYSDSLLAGLSGQTKVAVATVQFSSMPQGGHWRTKPWRSGAVARSASR
jgi:hypothetical protein